MIVIQFSNKYCKANPREGGSKPRTPQVSRLHFHSPPLFTPPQSSPVWRHADRPEELLEVDGAVAVGVAEAEDGGREARRVQCVREGALVQRVELLRGQALNAIES